MPRLQPAVLPPRSSHHPPSRPSNSCLLSLLQVNLVLGDGRSLGLTIRGGAEYGLGIYVTGVDAGSEAESSGLKVRAPRADFREVHGEHGEGGRGQELGGGDLGFTGSTERESGGGTEQLPLAFGRGDAVPLEKADGPGAVANCAWGSLNPQAAPG